MSIEQDDSDRVEQPLGPVLDDLGVTIGLLPAERVTEVYVIAKVTDLDDGSVGLALCTNELDWIVKGGLLAAAVAANDRHLLVHDGEADDD